MTQTFEFTVNGEVRRVDAAAELPLIYALRNELGLTATRFGCGLEQCGCCMVLIDDEPAYACTRAMDSIDGRAVVTAEGLAAPDDLNPLQQAFLDEQAGQCGYCLSGILVSATALLARNPNPSREDIAAALDGHLCRCGAHNRIIRAISAAAAAMRGEASA